MTLPISCARSRVQPEPYVLAGQVTLAGIVHADFDQAQTTDNHDQQEERASDQGQVHDQNDRLAAVASLGSKRNASIPRHQSSHSRGDIPSRRSQTSSKRYTSPGGVYQPRSAISRTTAQ